VAVARGVKTNKHQKQDSDHKSEQQHRRRLVSNKQPQQSLSHKTPLTSINFSYSLYTLNSL
jgi:hypothetical protein